MPPDSTSILRWYDLIERVYQQLDAMLAQDSAEASTQESGQQWGPLLREAAEYFDLDRLTIHGGPTPADKMPAVLFFPLLAAPGRAAELPAPSDRLSAARRPAPAGGHAQFHLRAQLRAGSGVAICRRPQLKQFAAHVERCLQLQQRLQAEEQALARLRNCLNQQPHAVLLCDGGGRATFVNDAGTELVQRVPGLCADQTGTRYLAPDGKDVLGPLFARARPGPQAASRVECSSGALHFTVIALPTPSCADGRAPEIALGLIIQEQASAGAQVQRMLAPAPAALQHRLREHYGLTDKEVELAHALTMGLSIGSYAKRCKRSPQTLRKQVKSIFAKLGVHDQKHLILRIWQEQQADWLACVNLLVACDAQDVGALDLKHSRFEAAPNSAPASASLEVVPQHHWPPKVAAGAKR